MSISRLDAHSRDLEYDRRLAKLGRGISSYAELHVPVASVTWATTYRPYLEWS
jgi:hypothetical protein